jgi:hypothetical protein
MSDRDEEIRARVRRHVRRILERLRVGDGNGEKENLRVKADGKPKRDRE